MSSYPFFCCVSAFHCPTLVSISNLYPDEFLPVSLYLSTMYRVCLFQDEEARIQFEVELRQQLARQAAAHSDHLQEVLKVQERELLQKYERQFNLKFIEERQAFQAEIAGWVARLKGIETAVESKFYLIVYIQILP